LFAGGHGKPFDDWPTERPRGWKRCPHHYWRGWIINYT